MLMDCNFSNIDCKFQYSQGVRVSCSVEDCSFEGTETMDFPPKGPAMKEDDEDEGLVDEDLIVLSLCLSRCKLWKHNW
ncbi:hypothetical protein K1719_026493 [Acacia pycnantha]|nr:hypothetical protein K1719_026493 [Acacia pycnantha]